MGIAFDKKIQVNDFSKRVLFYAPECFRWNGSAIMAMAQTGKTTLMKMKCYA